MKMVKVAALFVALAGSAAAFAPATPSFRADVSVAAEKSKSLPFLNRPPLVGVGYRVAATSTWLSPSS